MNTRVLGIHGVGRRAAENSWRRTGFARTLASNKTRQGYARKRILKPAGYFFVRWVSAAQGWTGSASWQR